MRTLRTIVIAAFVVALARAQDEPPPPEDFTPSPSSTSSGSNSRTPSPSATGSMTPTSSVSSTQTGTGSSSATNTASLSASATNTGTPSSSETSTSTSSPSSSGSATNTATPSSSQTGTGSPSNTRTSTASRSGTRTGTPSSSQTKSQTSTVSSSRTGTASPSQTRTGTSSASETQTGTPSSSETGSSSPSSSQTGTPSSSASPSATPPETPSGTASPSPVFPSWSDMVAVVRLGDAEMPIASVSAGTALPVYVDFYRVRPTAALVYSLPLPAGGSFNEDETVYTPGCTLATGKVTASWNFDTEGFPSNSANGLLGLLPCYDVPAGSPIGGDSPKTIATIDRTFRVDTSITGFISQVANDAANTNDGWRQVASSDGSKFYTASVAMFDAGFRYIASPRRLGEDGTIVSIPLLRSTVAAGVNDARSIVISGTRVYGICGGADRGFDSVFQFGSSSSLPTSSQSAVTKLSGMTALATPWTFVFADSSNVWVAVESTRTPKGTVQLWAKSGSSFKKSKTVTISSSKAVYSIAGRVEFGKFTLYATDGASVFRYDTSGSTVERLGGAATGTALRGVLFAGQPAASPSKSWTPTPSTSRVSRTRTPTKKRKALRE